MAKLTLTDLTQLTSNEAGAVADINANGALIETALENTLSRDGTSPNTMGAELDMNSNKITNLAAPTAASDAARYQDITNPSTLDAIGDVTITSIAANEIMVWNGSAWINQTLAEAGIAASPDLSGYITDITAEPLSDLVDVTITSIASGEVLQWNGSAWVNQTLTEAGIVGASTTNTLTNKTINTASNTITVVEADISDLQSYLVNLVEDTTPQLGAALDGQGYDLNNLGVVFLTEQVAAEADVAGKGQVWVQTATPNLLMFTDDAGTDFQLATLAGTETLTNKTINTASNTITIVEADISDLGTYETASGSSTLTNKTIDGDNNTISNLDLGNEVDWAVITDVSDASAFASGDKILIFEAGVGMRKIDYDDLPGAGAGLSNVVEDTTPQLGGNLDVNGFNVGGVTPTELGYVSGVTSAIQTQLGNKIGDITGEPLSDLSDVTITSIASGEILKWNGSAWINNTLTEAGIQAYDVDTLKADVADVLTKGFGTTAFSAGTFSSGTYTVDESDGNIQYATNNGAHTLAAPTNNCTVIVHYTNGASASTITTSGFTLEDGDSFTTTNADEFLCYIVKANDVAHLSVKALQ